VSHCAVQPCVGNFEIISANIKAGTRHLQTANAALATNVCIREQRCGRKESSQGQLWAYSVEKLQK